MTLDPTQVFIVTASFSLVSMAIGLLLGHKLAGRRDIRTLKREFRGFLGKWQQDIERLAEGDASGVYRVYVPGERELRGFVAKIESDLWRKRKFRKLYKPLIRLLPADITNEKGRDGDCRNILADPIETLKQWL